MFKMWSSQTSWGLHQTKRDSEGAHGLFQKCNACGMTLCLAARSRHVDWRAKTSQEIVDHFHRTGCCGHGEACAFTQLLLFLEGQLTMREFATLFEWDHRKVTGTVIVDYMLVSQIKDDERRAQEEDRCDLRCVFCHKIKTELFGDFMKTSVEYEYDPHLDAEKIRVKMERYESDTDPKCQGPMPDGEENCLFESVLDRFHAASLTLPIVFAQLFEWIIFMKCVMAGLLRPPFPTRSQEW